MNLKWFLRNVVYLLVTASFSFANAGSYEDFFQAIQRNDGRAVQGLLQRGMDPNTRDEKGQVGLYLALRGNAFDAADALLRHPETDVNASNTAGETPLMMAALRGRADWESRLLDRGATLHREGWSPVLYAASGPEPKALALLLDKGAPVDARAPNGTTPLMMAARYGSEASVQLLLARGADPKLRNDQSLTAADFARLAGREALAQRLQALLR
ncbi:ankyrin repeat domain-containing protein [Ideonella sp. BN130291]|uniref:ankyrin repeat domain-containing protein n=1 Tax=Ideonella sp. BN130291 TaxID=3112940 RepID=UPI002E254BD0|nr:ankyrin repeat domain-containing protein [Ideonella sp. BN130291]